MEEKRTIRRAVITGPTGTIGTALSRCLVKHGVTVYAVCRPDSPRISAIPHMEGLYVVECEASNLRRLPSLIPGDVDAFYHFAWVHTIGTGRNDMPAQINNIRYTIDAVRAAKALGCKVFLGAGSQAEYGRVEGLLKPDTPCFPENGYGMAKLCAGQMSRTECNALEMDHIWMRILSVYGPGDGEMTMITSTIKKLLIQERPSLTAGEQMWDYLYADDAAKAFYLAAVYGQDGAVYPLGSGQALPLRTYVEMLRDAINPSLALGFGEVPYASNQVMHLQADISTLHVDTGFVPAVSFHTGIRNTIAYIRNESNE